MNKCCSPDLKTNLHRLLNDQSYRNNFYRYMAPYKNLSEKGLMDHIGSFCSKVPAKEKQMHLKHLAALSQDTLCRNKKVRRRIGNIAYTIKNDPPYFYPRPYSYYNDRYRPFGGFLRALILLGILGAIIRRH